MNQIRGERLGLLMSDGTTEDVPTPCTPRGSPPCPSCCNGILNHRLSCFQTWLLDTEIYSRKAVRDAKLISNPGCYATAVQSLVAPILPLLDTQAHPTVFGISGYSGAGTKAAPSGTAAKGAGATVPKVSPEDLQGGVRPYSLTDHIHEREACRHLGRLAGKEDFSLAFVPSVAPWFQGIIATLSAPLKAKATAKDVRALYEEFYAGQGPLVELINKVPEVSDIALQHGIKIGGIQVHSSGRRVVVVGGIDNLLKGAATQCVQNLNIALGYDELAGIQS